MKHLYVLMSLPEDMDMLWIKFLSFVSVFCSSNFSCSMIVHTQEVFHVYLNKFEIAVSHLFLIIFSNNTFSLVN